MKTTTALMFIASIAVLAVMTLFLLNSSDNAQTENQITYTYPSKGTSTSYEVSHIVKGYEGAQYENTNYGMTDAEKQALFEQAQAQQEATAAYESARAIAAADNAQTFQKSEADRIEQYCADNGVLKCADIKYTCETEHECHVVTIECDDSSYDPQKEVSWGKRYECDDWQVTVATDSFDLRTTDFSYWESYGYGW